MAAAIFATVLLAVLPCASSHAYVYWPVSRNRQIAPSIAHCFNVPGPPVNFETAHNAGGMAGPRDFAKGLCGNFGAYQPSPIIGQDDIANWADAVPVETYQSGGEITFTIVVNAEHGGHYEFRLCDRKLDASIGSREDAARCFDAHFLGRMCVPQCGCNSDRCRDNAEHASPDDPIYSHGPPDHMQHGGHQVTVQLPSGVVCEHCTIQWFWHTAWGEQFWNCIDIRIKGGGGGPSPATTTALVTTTSAPSGGGGGDAEGFCIWTTPLGRDVATRKQSEKPGRICWEFEVQPGTVIHYQNKVDVYHSWNVDACCLVAGTSALEGPANVVTFVPTYGTFGFCECIGWTPETGGTTCAGQATAANMICPVAGSPGNMCLDSSAALARPASCGSTGSTPESTSPPVTAEPPSGTTLPPATTAPPSGCTPDWGNCIGSRCCASSQFTCYEADASYAECRNDGCPAGWDCNVLLPPGPPETCTDFCSLSPIVEGSCAAYSDEAACTSHYIARGAYSVPCSWKACGECVADGESILECTDLGLLCASGCHRLCGKVDLTLAGQTCNDLSGDQAQCTRSYFTKLGRRMPCKWTECRCYPDAEDLLQCDVDQLNDICGTFPPTADPTPEPEPVEPEPTPAPEPPTTGVALTTTESPSPTTAPCTDRHIKCPKWQNKCHMLVKKWQCPVTCGTCGLCFDGHEKCTTNWKNKCSQDSVAEKCPLTCGACDPAVMPTLPPVVVD